MNSGDSVAVLGSTGSVGRQALEVARGNPAKFRIEALAAHSNVELLLQQIAEFSPRIVAIGDEASAAIVQSRLSDLGPAGGCRVIAGPDAVTELVSECDSDCIVVGLTGVAALKPVLAALELGKKIALANKECLVAGGDLVKRVLRDSGGRIVSVDSEHSSIQQLLLGSAGRKVEKIILTASGGPFLRSTFAEIERATPAQAVKHPRWSMGAKISVDSATLMNKGLEVIEAAQLFDLPAERIEVLIHPESIVHGLVEFEDGTQFACCSESDMRLPIAHALSEILGCRMSSGVKKLKLAEWKALHFEQPDSERFPALRLAYNALRTGGSAPAVLNAANEVAVAAFLDGKISLPDIAKMVEAVVEGHTAVKIDSLDTLFAIDGAARESVQKLVSRGVVSTGLVSQASKLGASKLGASKTEESAA